MLTSASDGYGEEALTSKAGPPVPPGPNPLFFGVLLAVVIGAAVGIASSGTKTIMGSNLILRLASGGVGFVIAYVVVAAVWFAWQRKTFASLQFGPFGGSAPDQALDEETGARDEELANFMEATTEAIEEINAKVDDQE